MKLLNLPIIALIFSLCISGKNYAQGVTYSKVKVSFNDPAEIERLAGLGFDIDHPEFDDDGSIAFYATQDEISELRRQQFNVDVVIPDFNAYYTELLRNDSTNIPNMVRGSNVADGFDLGSMGGFYTNSEVAAKLDEMKQNYPNLITTKTSIGTSIEGRPIWMVKISDNPNSNEPEPTAYFDALQHAREPLAMATTINYMFWLLENYATDTAVQFLVDHRELYFVPVVNPDGYAYNEQTNPGGGGLWRKNRRPHPSGCFGVDLNRNYSFGYANNGSCSSTDPCSNVYRGNMAFSEPESVAVKDLMALIEPGTAFSTHSTAGTYLMPYGYDATPPDFEIYSEWASAFLSENNYTYGVTAQMLGYTSCGTTRDYLHSEGIYAWTPEIDGSGFWPPPSTIFDLVDENIRALYYQSWISGGYIDVQSHTQIGDALPGASFEFVVEVKNVGVGASAQTVSVVLEASVPEVVVPTANDYGIVAARTKKDNTGSPFTISIDPSFTGSSFVLTISTYQDGIRNEIKEIPIIVGNSTVLFSDDAENGIAAWNATGNGISWGQVADDSYSGDFSFGDSNGGNGENLTLNYFELVPSFDFTQTITPVVTFVSKRSIESDDFAAFQISTDAGANWLTLRQYSLNNDWNIEQFILDDYTTFGDVRFRFKMDTDNFIPGDGFYFDDFKVLDYDGEVLSNENGLTLSEFSIYPNPFNDVFIIALNDYLPENVGSVILLDITGRRMEVTYNIEISSIVVTKTETFTSGVYFLKIMDRTNSTILTGKLIKI